jgi:anti-sigma regulatory factor (Ser/Thr protein kinase)
MFVILRANDDAPRRARAALRGRLAPQQRVPLDVLDRLTLAASELVTNAERASRRMWFPFIVVYTSWSHDGQWVDLLVWDASWRLPRDDERQSAPLDIEAPDDLSALAELPEHGYGIMITGAVAAPVGWHRWPLGKAGISRVAAA